MKTLSKIATILLLALMTHNGNAQTISICAGESTVVTAINNQGLTSPAYSLNPGGITSPNPTFVVTPTSSVTYTLYVTGTNSNNITVTTSNSVMVQVNGVTFSLTSPQNFTLGCASKSICSMNITNANTTPVPGGPISYTFIAPGSPTNLPAGVLSPVSTATLNVAGTWSVVLRDNTNLCTTWFPVNIFLNTYVASFGSVSVTPAPINCLAPAALVQAPVNPNVQFLWSPSGTPGNSVSVPSNTSTPTQSIAVTLTLEATGISNLCQADTTIKVYQNIYQPNASITGPMPGPAYCNTLMLTNTSSSGIPINTFPTNAPVVALLWEGPSPQPTVALQSSYLAQTSGIYTLTARDNNNGCIKTTTYNVVLGPNAAFVHTVAVGQVTFNNVSTGTFVNSAYFWDFGDGNTSTLENPIHGYTNGGAHLVKFKVTNPVTFCADSVIQAVTVTGIGCSANSNFSMVPTGTPQVWNSIPAYPWNVSAATWNWGDGSSSNTLYTSHQYSAAGMYSICLSVTVNCVASSSTCTSFSVYRVMQSALMVEVNVIAPALISGLSAAGSDEAFAWKIVPNPNAGDFSLSLNNSKSETIRVVISDLMGRNLYSESVQNSPSLHIDTGTLPSGMYLVTVEEGNQKTTRRLLVNR